MFKAAAVAMGGIIGLCVILVAARKGHSAAGSESPIKGTSVEIALAIRTSLPSQYETTVLVEDNQPVPLMLQYNASALSSFDQRIRWRCDNGRLESAESPARNRFYPPGRAAVSTIEVEVGFHPRKEGATLPSAIYSEKAQLRVISPSPGSLLEHGVIDGFTIGEYLDPMARRSREGNEESYALIYPEKFLPPKAYYLVDDASRDLRISRHFRFGDFALDYPWFSLGKRQYIAFDYGLVRKTEDLINDMNRAGLPGDKIRIIYAFRPPAYNLGRIAKDGGESLKAPFSLHQYGKAVDFILDADGDFKMDDLDHDGVISVRDTIPIVHCVNALDRRYRTQKIPLYGGAGLYDHHDFWERPVQSPYVHVDVRGFLDQEGNLIRWPAVWPDTKLTISWGKL